MTEYVMVPKALLADIGLKFESGNIVPVTRVTITEEEWSEVMRSVKPVSAEPVAWRVSVESSYITKKEPFTHMVGSNRVVTPLYSAPQPEQQWVPVSERLPEDDSPVFVFMDHGDSHEIDLMSRDRFWKLNGVTHWMPLPQPPEYG